MLHTFGLHCGHFFNKLLADSSLCWWLLLWLLLKAWFT